MKKSLAFFLLIFAVFALTACNNKQAGQANNNFRRPDFGQPERQADISGLVKSVMGNEVTIIKMERPDFSQTNDQSNRSEETADNSESATPLTLGTNGASGMRMGNGMGPGGERPEMGENSESEMIKMIKEMSAGEEKVIIPVGIQMLKPGSSDDQTEGEMVEASLSDIVADKMVQIWLNEDVTDQNVASFVLITR